MNNKKRLGLPELNSLEGGAGDSTFQCFGEANSGLEQIAENWKLELWLLGFSFVLPFSLSLMPTISRI